MRSTTLDLSLLTVLIAGLVYLSVDAWFSEDGVRQLGSLRAELATAEAALAEREAARDALSAKTDRLKGPEIDRDLLDERLRAAFGVGRADEVLLIGPAD